MTGWVRIELDPGSTQVAGRVCPATGQPLSFTGYVELIAALEGLRRAEHDPEPEPDADSPALA
ncbi:MAG: hypothetical protein WD844_08930 [Thermoleophilaceae bacterium]